MSAAGTGSTALQQQATRMKSALGCKGWLTCTAALKRKPCQYLAHQSQNLAPVLSRLCQLHLCRGYEMPNPRSTLRHGASQSFHAPDSSADLQAGAVLGALRLCAGIPLSDLPLLRCLGCLGSCSVCLPLPLGSCFSITASSLLGLQRCQCALNSLRPRLGQVQKAVAAGPATAASPAHRSNT